MKNYLWNMLNSIKNGQLAKKDIIVQKRKKICESILKILWDEGFILGYQIIYNSTKFKIFLKYSKTGKPIINSLKFVSKPGKRTYFNTKQVWKINSNKAFIIFSTHKGLKSLQECKKQKIGGEPLVIIK